VLVCPPPPKKTLTHHTRHAHLLHLPFSSTPPTHTHEEACLPFIEHLKRTSVVKSQRCVLHIMRKLKKYQVTYTQDFSFNIAHILMRSYQSSHTTSMPCKILNPTRTGNTRSHPLSHTKLIRTKITKPYSVHRHAF